MNINICTCLYSHVSLAEEIIKRKHRKIFGGENQNIDLFMDVMLGC